MNIVPDKEQWDFTCRDCGEPVTGYEELDPDVYRDLRSAETRVLLRHFLVFPCRHDSGWVITPKD